MDSDSDSSSLSSAPEEEVLKLAPIFQKAKKATKLVAPPPPVSPPRPKRPPSPPHEEVLADNPDIAFIAMFRSRFSEAMPGKLPNFGPQDIERGVVDTVPSPQMESLLCALLGLVLNRKKPVERGHHGRALEEAVLSHRSQWPLKWNFQNPLHGGNDFNSMTPTNRLNLLRTLIMWSLTSSEAISEVIKSRYKQSRHNDDENQSLSVQPWGFDGDKRRYFLIQGLDDTSFRVYRENSRHTRNATWWSVAGDIGEVKALAEKLEKQDGSQAARRLAVKMTNAIPIFEATEEKRHRREYRQQRRAAFSRPEPGFGIYEGRTRGKRLRYTYDDDDAFESDATSTRRSTRHQSARSTPFDSGPTMTASGRQVRRPQQGDYGESLLSNTVMNSTDELAPEYEDHANNQSFASDESDAIRPGARATRSGGRAPADGHLNPRKRKHIDGYNDIDEMSDEADASASGDEWDSDRNEADEDHDMPDADADGDESDLSDDEGMDRDDDEPAQSYILKLKVPNLERVMPRDTPPTSPPSTTDGIPAQITSASLQPLPSDEGAKAEPGLPILQPTADASAVFTGPTAVTSTGAERATAPNLLNGSASTYSPTPTFSTKMAQYTAPIVDTPAADPPVVAPEQNSIARPASTSNAGSNPPGLFQSYPPVFTNGHL